MYADIFTGDYATNMAFKELKSGTTLSQIAIKNKGYKILLDFTIHCDTKTEARRPDTFFIDRTKKEVKIVDFTILADVLVNQREVRKI